MTTTKVYSVDKRKLHHIWTKIRPLRPWYFLVLALVSGVICLFAMRANNLHMVSLRNQVYQADKSDGDVETALRNLREYVYSHMNTSLASGPDAVHPPIQLQYTYQRLEQAEAASANQGNLGLTTAAQKYCEKLDPTDFSGHNRVPCVESYILSHNTLAIAPIPKGDYEFDFVSAKWSPDLAGWSLVATIALVVLFGIFWVFQKVIRYMLHNHRTKKK